MSHQQYIIIGLGVCGTAAALQLLRTKTCCTLTIISHHRPSEPSNDISKIVRIDYAEKERIEEASRAQHHWMNDEQFKTFYQPVGRIVAYEDGDGTLAGIDAARSELQLPRRERWDINILNKYYGHTRASANLHYIWNEDDGLVEWKGCMEALRSYIHQHKATRIVHGQAERLYHDAGRIRTISVDGRSIDVNDAQVILAAGPWISEMMDQSEISQPPSLRVPVATGVFACFVQLDEEQRQFFRGKPAFSHIGYG
jgi:glycine/D-amino acid oxidase-like deaminating enzyme